MMHAAMRGKVMQCMQPQGLHEVDLVAGKHDDNVQICLLLGLLLLHLLPQLVGSLLNLSLLPICLQWICSNHPRLC